jgi:pSer/pThr/pTyr-binding forkhead associated (FHA) protein
MPTDRISAEAYLFIEVRDRVYRYRFENAVTSVGTAEDNVVRIKEPSVAAHHLLITYVDGKFFLRRVEDSRVRLNGEGVDTWSEELRHGDVLGIGDVRLRLAEGGKASDTAVMLVLYPHVDEVARPFSVFVSRKPDLTLGDPPADVLVPKAVDNGPLRIENLGGGCEYVVMPDKGTGAALNEEPIVRRVRLKDRDVIKVRGCTIRVRLLRGEVMDDAETLLSAEALRRFSLPEERRT